MKQAHTSMLEQLRTEWQKRGWTIDDLKSFRMEGEGDGGTGSNGGEGGTGGSGDPKDPPAKSFTQEEMSAIAAREKNEGKRAAEESLSKQLGVSLDEAKRIIAAAKANEDQQKTDAQRAKEAADSEKAAADEEKRTAAKERHDARLERALIRVLPRDLSDEDLDKKVARVSRMLDVEVGADDVAIKAAITTLQKEMPELFPKDSTGGGGGGQKPPPNGDPKGGPPKDKKPPEDAFSRGMERAKTATSVTQYPILEQFNS